MSAEVEWADGRQVTKGKTEFLRAVQDYATTGRYLVVTVPVEIKARAEQGQGSVSLYRPFRPKYLLIDGAAEAVAIQDIMLGNQSQCGTWSGSSTALYDVKTLRQHLFGDPSQTFPEPKGPFSHPAWDLFRFSLNGDGISRVHESLSVRLESKGYAQENRLVNCLFIGDEPNFVPWEAEIQGTLATVAMGRHGPYVEVMTRDNGETLRVPCMPVEVPMLMSKIGKHVQFKLLVKD